MEWGDPPVNYFNVSILNSMFDAYIANGYNIIYKRPMDNELLNDDNLQSELRDHELIRSQYQGQVLTYTDIVETIETELSIQLNSTWKQVVQLSVMANVDEFVSVQGGNSVLASLFCRKHTILFHRGQEYGAGDFSFYPRLNSNNECNLRVYQDEALMIEHLQGKDEDHTEQPCKGCTPKDCHCSYIT